MNLNEYSNFARDTAVYPDKLTCSVNELMYLALGLAGEAGEVANKVKKLYRDSDSVEAREKIVGELGDVLWYWVRLCDSLACNELAMNPDAVISANVEKLANRKSAGKLHGSGDNR